MSCSYAAGGNPASLDPDCCQNAMRVPWVCAGSVCQFLGFSVTTNSFWTSICIGILTVNVGSVLDSVM